MSYSIFAMGATKEAAWEDAKAKIVAATKNQRAHDADREAIVANIAVLVGALPDDADKDVQIEAYGHAGVSSLLTPFAEIDAHIKVRLVARVDASGAK